MQNNYFGERFRATRSSEKAETMPAAIITAIITSILLLGIATAISFILQSRADGKEQVALATVVSNVDIALRSDVSQASYLKAAAKLKQPAARLLTETDLLLSGVNMHLPEANGECKVIRWSVNGSTVSRDLTVYKTSINERSLVKCDESSEKIAERNKVFAENIIVQAPFQFHNQLGHELIFKLKDTALTEVNAKLDAQLTAKGTDKLEDTEFNQLNTLLNSTSFIVGFPDVTACIMNADKVDGVCPAPETTSVADAWNSKKIAKVSVMFMMQNTEGEMVRRDIEQSSSVPLYANADEAEAEVAGVR